MLPCFFVKSLFANTCTDLFFLEKNCPLESILKFKNEIEHACQLQSFLNDNAWLVLQFSSPHIFSTLMSRKIFFVNQNLLCLGCGMKPLFSIKALFSGETFKIYCSDAEWYHLKFSFWGLFIRSKTQILSKPSRYYFSFKSFISPLR